MAECLLYKKHCGEYGKKLNFYIIYSSSKQHRIVGKLAKSKR